MTGISVVIPTFGRNEVLVHTITRLLSQMPLNGELIVVDQTPEHDSETNDALEAWDSAGQIRWLRLSEPSVTRAMNQGLLAAAHSVVLFVDDDIDPARELVVEHLNIHHRWSGDLVAGRVIQPWQMDLPADPGSPFNSPNEGPRTEFMGGNFSVKRCAALAMGGFDENFRFAAYRYEREFADRLQNQGGRIYYIPHAVVYHLQAPRGGVRSFGSHLTTASPGHSQGAYYYLLGSGRGWFSRILKRFLLAPMTRFHLKKPWFIPLTIIAELRGLLLAVRLRQRGPKLLSARDIEISDESQVIS
ncbi:MAG: glycosyltransferase [Gammaproteobacteria bacterium]|nr:glycosyltransferase [Gammaproteobacteria bacterium]